MSPFAASVVGPEGPTAPGAPNPAPPTPNCAPPTTWTTGCCYTNTGYGCGYYTKTCCWGCC